MLARLLVGSAALSGFSGLLIILLFGEFFIQGLLLIVFGLTLVLFAVGIGPSVGMASVIPQLWRFRKEEREIEKPPTD